VEALDLAPDAERAADLRSDGPVGETFGRAGVVGAPGAGPAVLPGPRPLMIPHRFFAGLFSRGLA
jgi:hypothetical protein